MFFNFINKMNKISFTILAIIVLVFFMGFMFFRLDDAYIFYQYAKNIADGNGYVFNIGEKVNATTSPLYTLLLAFVYFIVKPLLPYSLEYVGAIVSIISVLVILFLLYKLLKDDERFFITSLIFFSMPVLKYGFGMETFFNLALILASIYYFTQEQFALSFSLAGLSILARLDSFLFAGILFLFYIIKYKKLPSFKVILFFLLMIIPWFVFSKFYFDSLLPTTIALKLTQHKLGIFGNGLIFLTGSVIHIPGKIFTISGIIILLIISLSYFKIKRITLFANDGIKILSYWSIALFILYAFVINAPPYKWYYIPFTIMLAITFSLFITNVVKSFIHKRILFAILFLSAITLPVKNFIEGYNAKYSNFIKVTDWLNYNAEEGSSIAADDIGILGYHYKRGKMVDALGLVNPEISQQLLNKNYNWLVDHYKPDYIVHEYPELMHYLRGDKINFKKKYEVIKVFETKGEHIAIYKRKAPQDL